MTKKLCKAAALLLTLTLLLGAFALPAQAATLGEDMTFGKISEYKDFYEQHRHAADTVAKGIYDLETQINIADDRIAPEDLPMLYTVVTHTHPELFYTSMLYSYSYYTENSTSYVYALHVHWAKTIYDENGNYIIENGLPKEETFTDEQVLAMRGEFRARAQWYLDLVDDSMSDFDKALVLHDALILNSHYLLQGETYDLLVNGRGKCYGYSEAYAYLLAQVGVNSEIVESEEMFHQWNKVEIDGVYYNVDVTHDDPLPDKPGMAEHTYFLLSDAAIQADEASPHVGYVSDFPSDDTRYDNKSYHRLNTQLIPAGGRYYAVDNTQAGRELLLYDVQTDETESVYSFADAYWNVKEYLGYVYPDMYMALQEQDGYLYMNTADKVLAYDTVNGEMTDFAPNTFDKSFYGLRITDGSVYAALADSPNETGTLVSVGACLPRVSPVRVNGDLNNDGSLSVDDVTLLQRHLAEFEALTEAQLAYADVDGDGKINVHDVTQLQRILAEMA